MEVSVIIPVYNAAKFVEKAVQSALQFEDVKEVLLIEDGSPDNALDICQKLESAHERVKLFQHPDKGNHGAGASRNLGIRNASCPFIAFLDADDFYLPNRFEADRKVFAENPDGDGVYNALGFFYYSQTLRYEYIKKRQEKISIIKEKIEPVILPYRLLGIPKHIGYFTLDGLTIRREIALKVGLFNEILKLHQDTDFIIKTAIKGRLYPGELKKPIGMRGVHEKNRSLAIPNLNYTRSQLFHSLLFWTKENEVNEQLVEIIRNKYYLHKIHSCKWFHSCIWFIKGTLSSKGFFKKSRFFNPALSKFISNEKLLNFMIKAKEKTQLTLGLSLD